MQFSRAVDYALRSLAFLAALPPGTVATRSNLARETRVADAFLAKVMRKLVRAHLVKSHPGVHGGFTLRLLPEQISLMHVVEAVDGPWNMQACLLHSEPCGHRDWCGVHDALAGVRNETIRVLKTTTLAQISAPPLTKISTA